MKKDNTNSQLQVILNEQNVAKENAARLIEAFGAPFTEAGEILLKYRAVKVTSAEQTEQMEQAREMRLNLKRVRTGVEKKRKELKEAALREGKAIDSVAKFVRETIEPAEKYLEMQEKFVEIEKEKEAALKRGARIEKLSQYDIDIAAYNVDALTDAAFDVLVQGLEADKQKKLAEWKAAEEAEAKAHAEREEADRKMREENERLRKEAEEREAKEKARLQAEADERNRVERERERERQERERKEEYERVANIKVHLLKFAHGMQNEKDCVKNAEQLETFYSKLPESDRLNPTVDAAYNKSKAELIEIATYLKEQEANRLEMLRQEEEAKAKAQAAAAPDKEKIMQFAKGLELIRITKIPHVNSEKAQLITKRIDKMLTQMQEIIVEDVAKL